MITLDYFYFDLLNIFTLSSNRPVPNKFTEYRDPDFESQEYDDLSD